MEGVIYIMGKIYKNNNSFCLKNKFSYNYKTMSTSLKHIHKISHFHLTLVNQFNDGKNPLVFFNIILFSKHILLPKPI